jgi:hypothetical protein
MSAYEWSCSSCGHANDAACLACSRCSCPSRATIKQIAAFREKYASHGGPVLATAAIVDDPDGLAALRHVGKVVVTGLGWLAWIAGTSR